MGLLIVSVVLFTSTIEWKLLYNLGLKSNIAANTTQLKLFKTTKFNKIGLMGCSKSYAVGSIKLPTTLQIVNKICTAIKKKIVVDWSTSSKLCDKKLSNMISKKYRLLKTSNECWIDEDGRCMCLKDAMLRYCAAGIQTMPTRLLLLVMLLYYFSKLLKILVF